MERHSIYQSVCKPLLFQTNPDKLHEAMVETGYLLGKTTITRNSLKLLFNYENEKLNTQVFNLNFKNPLGLSGGFDKKCKLIQTIPFLGFGFTEIGSITFHPYQGNKQPWNIRLKKDKSILVNYGLKNEGVQILKARIQAQKRSCPVIINIAKTNDPTIKGEAGIDDYITSFRALQSLADIVNLNISCPNTGDGTLLCEDLDLLAILLKKLSEAQITKPIVMKLKPDISDEKLYELLKLCNKYEFIKGFTISNLTRTRKNLKTKLNSNLPGGISGKPLKKLSDKMIQKTYSFTKGKKTIIGCGGIFTAEDAYEKIILGSSLIQLVTGMIYKGPGIAKEINQGLVKLLEKDNFRNIQEAVGYKN